MTAVDLVLGEFGGGAKLDTSMIWNDEIELYVLLSLAMCNGNFPLLGINAFIAEGNYGLSS